MKGKADNEVKVKIVKSQRCQARKGKGNKDGSPFGVVIKLTRKDHTMGINTVLMIMIDMINFEKPARELRP